MAKPMDFLTGIVEGASETFASERKRRQQQADAIALLRAKARIEREENPPMDPTAVMNLIKGSGLQPTGVSLSAKGEPTFKFGTPKPEPGAAKNAAFIKQAQAAKAQLEEIYKLAETSLPAIRDTVPYVPEGVEANIKGGLRWLGAKSGFNESARAFLDTSVADARQIIRWLGETGVLTTPDVSDAQRLLPLSGDSATMRRDKLSKLQRLIDRKIQVYQTNQVPTAEQELASEDLSQLSDEELEAIAAGQ